MGAPVSDRLWPRTRPSVDSMAMVRTVFSPRCWATSRTRRSAPSVLDLEGVENLGELLVELDVDDGADHLGDLAVAHGGGRAAESTAASACKCKT